MIGGIVRMEYGVAVTAVIVQARMGSTRLPGKVMMEIAGHSALEHVLARCRAVPGADVLCCATALDSSCDVVADEARRCGAKVFRGSETDVLDRYHRAARAVGAEVVLRVTSDCPLIDPEVCGEVLGLRHETAAGYACNNKPRTWPMGLDCEAFTADALERAAGQATKPYDREHVGPWMARNPSIKRVNLPCPGGTLAEQRWTLDFPEDLAFFRALAEILPPFPAIPGWREVADVLRRHPEITDINRGCPGPDSSPAPRLDEGKPRT